MTVFTGTARDDVFNGGADGDIATGLGGRDQLSGGPGRDQLAGGAGADVLFGGDDGDLLFAGEMSPQSEDYPDDYSAILDTGSEVDTLNGGGGEDQISAGYGDNVDGGASVYGDILYISFLASKVGVVADFRLSVLNIGGGVIENIERLSYVQGSNFDDVITAYSNDWVPGPGTRIHGMGGNDKLTADSNTIAMYGDEGDDVLDGRAFGVQRLDGGSGNDTIYCGVDRLTKSYGGDGDDLIYGAGAVYAGSGNDEIHMQWTQYGDAVLGEAGNDVMYAAESGSYLFGGSGVDRLYGGDNLDRLYSADRLDDRPYLQQPADDMGLEKDIITGGGGDDEIAIGYGDSADGGADSDTLRLSLGGLKTGIVFDTKGIVSGKAFTLGGGTIKNIGTLAYLRGTDFNDTLTLATQDTLLEVNAGAGDDTIISNASSVAVMGGKGADRFISGVAGDTFDGGEGVDTIDYSRSTTAVTVNLNTGVGARGDTLTNVENIAGSNLNDTLTGSAFANVLDGGKGGDKLDGGAGDDVYVVDDLKDTVTEGKNAGVDTVNAAVSWTLGANLENLALTGSVGTTGVGNAVANTLVGNGAANILRGLGGADVLTGGAGADVFDFDSLTDSTVAAFDRITDLTDSDRIDLSGIDANTKSKGDQAFAIVDAFTHKAGQMTLAYSAATKLTTILMDVDGDGKADMKIVLNGDHHDYDNFFL